LVFAESREAEFVDKLKGMTYEEIAARGGGILNSAAKLQQMDESELFDQSLVRLKAVEEAGIGAIEIKSGYGLTVADELKMLRVIQRLKAHSPLCIKSTFLALHAVPLAYSGKKTAFIELMVDELLPRVAAEGLADFVDVFCEKNYFDIEDMVRVIEAGQNHGLRAKVHVNQFNSFGGIQAAVAANALSVDHLEVMTAADIDALRGSETIPTVLPGCSFYLRIPYAPARAMIDAGLPVAIASDFNPGSAPSYNPELNMSMACIQQRLLPEEAIHAATVNAAAAMDVSLDFGSIEKKKKANIVLTRPLPSLAYLPYAFGEKKISRLMLNGEFC
jgi:imidazolonepropionase